MSSSMREPLTPVVSVEDSLPQQPKILEALGFRVAALAQSIVNRARSLPILGRPIGYVEDTSSPWLEPILSVVEKDGVYVLSVVDNQIHTVSNVAMAHVPLAAKVIPQLQLLLSGQPLDLILLALDRVRVRGVVGSTADVWVEYEPVVKNRSQSIYNLANRVPGLNIAALVFHDISSPFISVASNWLVTHSEIKDKHEILLLEGTSPSSSDSLATPDQDSKTNGTDGLDFNAMAEETDSDKQDSSDAENHAENSGEIDVVQLKDEEPSSPKADIKEKYPELTVLHEDEDEDESDEVTDLFDTWGMGVKVSSPRGFKTLRTQSVKEATQPKKATVRPFTSLTRSFRF